MNRSTISAVRDRVLDKPWVSPSEFFSAAARSLIGDVDPRLSAQASASGSSETIMGDGGFLPPSFLSEALMPKYPTGAILSRVRVFERTLPTGTFDIPLFDETSRVAGSALGGVSPAWLQEGDALPASKPKFRRVSLHRQKLGCVVYATSEQLADSTYVELMTNAVSTLLRTQLEDAIVGGTGVGQPLGIRSAPATVSVATDGAGAGTIIGKNVERQASRFWPGSWQSPAACWVAHPDAVFQLGEMGAAATPYLSWTETGARLFGLPLVPVEVCPALGTPGDITLADWSQYAVFQSPIASAVSIHAKYVSDEIALRFLLRADGSPLWASAVTPRYGSNTASPFVTIQAR